jgi:hypothetical protein
MQNCSTWDVLIKQLGIMDSFWRTNLGKLVHAENAPHIFPMLRGGQYQQRSRDGKRKLTAPASLRKHVE